MLDVVPSTGLYTEDVKKVLFLCVGNSCRSQMAEGFARKYGLDVIQPASAGLSPASIVQPLTKKVMEAKNININTQHPKGLDSLPVRSFDLIVNMSGTPLPRQVPVAVREWPIDDPIGCSEDTYLAVRDQIEMQVMLLILELRREEEKAGSGGETPTVEKQKRGFRPRRSETALNPNRQDR